MPRAHPSPGSGAPEPAAGPGSVRVDVWLDVSCLFRTRSAAQKACKAGRVTINGRRVKPHCDIRAGDEVVLSRPLGRTQRIRVVEVRDRHTRRTQAKTLYQDLTPPPSANEVEARRLERLARALSGPAPAGAPSKRDRRLLRRLKGRDE